MEDRAVGRALRVGRHRLEVIRRAGLEAGQRCGHRQHHRAAADRLAGRCRAARQVRIGPVEERDGRGDPSSGQRWRSVWPRWPKSPWPSPSWPWAARGRGIEARDRAVGGEVGRCSPPRSNTSCRVGGRSARGHRHVACPAADRLAGRRRRAAHQVRIGPSRNETVVAAPSGSTVALSVAVVDVTDEAAAVVATGGVATAAAVVKLISEPSTSPPTLLAPTQ